ncbi:MAG: MmgE/PrpD family protein [Rhodoglobus sp.]|nr:MmgE/PrpD family protein [Rhodoglobus sp.]
MPATNEPIAQSLGRYVADRQVAIPDGVRARARMAVLDTIGCMIGATGTETGHRILRYASRRGALGRATAVGIGHGLRAEDAGLANGTLAHLLEFDDGHRPSDNHLGCVVVPAALAMAEETGASVADFLDAVVIGYDVMGRTGEATLLTRDSSKFHGTGTTGVFGSAAVAARLLELDAEKAAQAIVIAGTAAAGPKETLKSGQESKPLHSGRAVMNGITSAFLAADGYTGPLPLFESEIGFCAAMCSHPRPDMILQDLGTRYSLVESGFKVHSTCGMLFTTLDGILEARSRHGLQDRIPKEIRIGVPSWLVDDPVFVKRRPTSTGEARFSIPYAAAAGIVDGEVTLRQMTPDNLGDPHIAMVEERITVGYDKEIEEVFLRTREDAFFYYGASIEYELDGQTFRTVHLTPHGYDPEDLLTRDQIVAKFRSTVALQLDESAQNAIISQVFDSDESDPAKGIAALMASVPVSLDEQPPTYQRSVL